MVGIELLCGAQAMEFVDDRLEPGSGTGVAYDTIREVIPPLDEDRPLHAEIEIASELIVTGKLEAQVEKVVNETTV